MGEFMNYFWVRAMRRSTLLLAALVLVFGVNAQDTKVQVKSFDQVVSESATIFVSIKNAGELRQKLEAEPFSKMRENAEMKKWLDGLLTGFSKVSKEGLKDFGIDAEEIFNASGGEVAFTFDELDLAKPDSAPKGAAVLIDARDKQADFQKIFDKVLETLAKKDYEKSSDKINDVPVTRFERQVEGKTEKEVLVFANLDTVYLLASSNETIRTLIANLKAKDSDKVLATNPAYKATKAKVGDCDALAYMSFSFFKDMLKSVNDETQRDIAEKMLDQFGLLALKGVGGGVSLGKEGIKLNFYAFTPEKKGLFAIMSKNEKLEFPKVIPEDAASVSISRMDIQEFWKVMDKLVEAIQEQMKEQGQDMDLKQVLQQFLGVDIKADIIDHLGNTFWQYGKYTKPYKNADSQKQVMGVSVKDEKKLRDSMQTVVDTLSNMPQGSVDEEEYLGKKIWKLTQGEETFAISVAGPNLLFGDLEAAKEVIRRLDKEEKTVFDTEHFKSLAKLAPEKVISLTYYSGEGLAWAVAQLKEGRIPGQPELPELPGAPQNLGENLEQFFKLINAKNLPDPETFTEYVHGSVGYLVADDHGFHFVNDLRFK